MPRSYLITGANRGIGLGLAARLLARGDVVYAGARNPHGARELWELERDYPGHCRMVELDVAADDSVAAAAAELGDVAIDMLVNNAGIAAEWETLLERLDMAQVRRVLEVNTLGPLRVTRALLANLRRGTTPLAAVIGSHLGSLAETASVRSYPYRMAKAGAHMFARTLAAEHSWLTSVIIHPGWVRTELGGSAAPTSVAESVDGIVQVLDQTRPADSGRFVDYLGRSVPF